MPAQFALSGYELLANKKITVIALPRYLLDLVSCDLCVPKTEDGIKGREI